MCFPPHFKPAISLGPASRTRLNGKMLTEIGINRRGTRLARRAGGRVYSEAFCSPANSTLDLHPEAPHEKMAGMRKLLFAFLFVLAGGMALAVSPAAAQGTTPGQPAQATAPNPAAAPGQPSQPAPAFKSQKDEISYALGLTWGTNLRKESVEIDPDVLLQGLKDAIAGGKAQMTEDEAHNALVKFQNDLKTRDAEKYRSEGDAYRAANKSKEGVVTLPSGLQYKILVAGTGPKPMLTDQVTCNYRGSLIDGTEFDSSYKRGEPSTFPINRVIKGWTEALQLMPVGSKWQLVIPPDLAYGAGGRPGAIPPNATLVFEVELISIVVKQPGQPANP